MGPDDGREARGRAGARPRPGVRPARGPGGGALRRAGAGLPAVSAADDLRQRKAELERRLERCGAVPGRDRAGSWQVSARLPSDLVREWLALEAELAAEREC